MTEPQLQPPQWANRLLAFFLRPDVADEIIGDLHEAFFWRVEKLGYQKAKRKFIWEAIRSLRLSNLKSYYHLSLNTMIFRNYFKIALRGLLKRRATSFINIFGLSIGAGAFIIIFLYAFQILTQDQVHSKKDRIFLAYKERITPDGTQAAYDTWVPMKDRLISEYTQVKGGARFYQTNARVISGNRFIEEEITYTDSDFFKIFDYPIIHGKQHLSLPNKNSIAITKELAYKHFQKENAIGESMEIYLPEEDTTLRFQVSAIIGGYPSNTSIQLGLVILLEALPVYPEIANEWDGSFLETFVLVEEPQDAVDLEAAFPNLVESIWGPETRENTNFKLLPFDSYYDTFLGSKSNARTLLYIGMGILLIAAINFMNLSTAQASRRTKEIGVRKVLGAFRGQIGTQLVTEAFVTSLVASILGVALAILAIPYFNDFFDVSITVQIFSIGEIIGFCLAMAVLMGLLSGSYPAIYLSSIGAIDAMRQKMGLGGSVDFRNGLVVVQFTIALFLISSSIFIRNQIEFMTTRSMGFEDHGVLVINASRRDFTSQEEGIDRLNGFKNELKSKSYVSSMALSRAVPTSWTRSFVFVRPDGWDGDPLRMRYTFVDGNFFDLYDIPIKHGRNFFADSEGDQRGAVIINEAAARAFEFDPVVENAIKIGDQRIPVVGVAQDFHFESLQNDIAPTLIFHRVATNPVHSYISCKIELSNLQSKMSEIEELWNTLGSTNEFTYSFMDENIEQLYEAEKRYLGLVAFFSTLAIIVACVGIYGLTLFIIEKRRKEISVRKVLGAETNRILALIFKDFTKWVGIAFVISVPLVIYFISGWLAEYHYRVSITWLNFALAFVLVLALVIFTVGYQSIKAAMANPVKYLKDE